MLGAMNDVATLPAGNTQDFARIARCDRVRRGPFPRAAVARADRVRCGWSEYHFARVFRRWAGISPKQFVQHLSLAAAKQTLAADESVLQAALDAGLSGPGRLHDLFVAFEAVTPGEFKSRGRGLTMRFGTAQTPFGPARIAATERGIAFLAFEDSTGRVRRLGRVSGRLVRRCVAGGPGGGAGHRARRYGAWRPRTPGASRSGCTAPTSRSGCGRRCSKRQRRRR